MSQEKAHFDASDNRQNTSEMRRATADHDRNHLK
jgi:hypothetical protein